MATVPDWTISRMPNGSSAASRASSLPGPPVASMTTVSGHDVDDVRAEQLDDLEHVGALRGVGPDLDQQQLALHRRGVLELDDLDHVDQLVQLLGHLLERQRVDVDDDGDARDLVVLGRARPRASGC